MSDEPIDVPVLAAKSLAMGEELGFRLASDARTGSLLRTLVASKRGGRVLEVGAGLGAGTAWILAGMDPTARLVSLEIDEEAADIVRDLFKDEPRLELVHTDATEWLERYDGPPFDLVFVDTTITKFERRDLLLRCMAPGALLVADDLLPGPTWTENHPPRVERLRHEIVREDGLVATLMDWASGLVVATRV